VLNFSEGGKYLRTRDNRRVRIYATDGGGFYSIHGAVASGNSYWEPMTWTENGVWRAQSNLHRNDLVPYAPTVTWLVECPEGVEPIVLLPHSEHVSFSITPTNVSGSGCTAGPFVSCVGCKTVQPRKAT